MYTMARIVKSTNESVKNKNTKILTLFGTYVYYIKVIITIIFHLVNISLKQLKLIITYFTMLYDTCDYHILNYSKLINVYLITTVRIANLTSKSMNNSCALL